jgi:hypothetical protein
MSRQVQLLKQDLTVSQILRTYGKQFRQIAERYSDGDNGRCAMGVIWSYFGWDGKPDSDMTSSVNAALPTLAKIGLNDDIFIIELNDKGWSFDEIANYIDKIGNNRNMHD